MPIICLEGASAVGKSTTAKELANKHNAYVVAEPSFLFKRPADLKDPSDELKWLLEYHLKRWDISLEKSRTHDLVVMDGDHIKMWYDWVYGLDDATFNFYVDFFSGNIKDKKIGFPDAYYVLYIDDDLLKERKSGDLTRSRRNFDKHLKLIEPQKRMFLALNNMIPGYCTLINAQTVENKVKTIFESTKSLPKIDRYSVELFDYMVGWMDENPPV